MPVSQFQRFSIGDRVVLVQDFPDNNSSLRRGHSGTVVGLPDQSRYRPEEDSLCGVMFDEPFHQGHDLSGRCGVDNGWWTKSSFLKLVCDEEIPEEDIASMDDLLSMLSC